MGISDSAGFDGWREQLALHGWVLVPGAAISAALDPLDDWAAFAASWDALDVDAYMADQGRYRRRRHAVFACGPHGDILRKPHQPHFQSLQYNPLHGDLERWFSPISAAVGAGASLRSVLLGARSVFAPLKPEVLRWRVEVHQFRIESMSGLPGLPTPEGLHRDGVDFVLVLMIQRRNIAAGTTTIHGADHLTLGSFTLTEPLDAALVDDHRCFHGVTAVTALDPAQPAYRDVLVVTFADDSQTR